MIMYYFLLVNIVHLHKLPIIRNAHIALNDAVCFSVLIHSSMQAHDNLLTCSRLMIAFLLLKLTEGEGSGLEYCPQ